MPLHKPSGLRRIPKLGGSSQRSSDDSRPSMDSRISEIHKAHQGCPGETPEQKIRKLIKQLKDRTDRIVYLLTAENVLIYKPNKGEIPDTLEVDKAERQRRENERMERVKVELGADGRNTDHIKPHGIRIETLPTRDNSVKIIARTRGMKAYLTDKRMKADLNTELNTIATDLLDKHTQLKERLART